MLIVEILGTYCGTQLPNVIETTLNEAFVTFHSDDRDYIAFRGFSLNFTSNQESKRNFKTNFFFQKINIFLSIYSLRWWTYRIDRYNKVTWVSKCNNTFQVQALAQVYKISKRYYIFSNRYIILYIYYPLTDIAIGESNYR